MKRFSRCKEIKDESEFNKDRRRPDGREKICKTCRAEYRKHTREQDRERSAKYYRIHADEIKTYNRKYYREHANAAIAYSHRYNAEHKEEIYTRNRRKKLMKQYGITPEEYDKLFSKQNGACAICGNIPTNGKKLAVDHSHITGKVRGLLCHSCNVTLGNVDDSIELLTKAIEYLSKVD